MVVLRLQKVGWLVPLLLIAAGTAHAADALDTGHVTMEISAVTLKVPLAVVPPLKQPEPAAVPIAAPTAAEAGTATVLLSFGDSSFLRLVDQRSLRLNGRLVPYRVVSASNGSLTVTFTVGTPTSAETPATPERIVVSGTIGAGHRFVGESEPPAPTP